MKSRSLGWVRQLTHVLVKAGIRPNTISLVGIGFAALAFAALYSIGRMNLPTWPMLVLAAICVQARLMCNMMDGLVAIEGGLKSKGGDLFNEIPDRIEDALFLTGAGYACGQVTLGLICALLAVFTAYLRAFGASLGHGQDFGGPCAKPHRMFFLTVGLLLQTLAIFFHRPWNVLAWSLWLIVALTAITAVLRALRMYQKSA